VESIIRSLRIHSLRGQVESSRCYCCSLASQFEATPSNVEKTRIAQRYDAALKQTHMLQLLLELLEREQRQIKAEAVL
jgi:hypothetical protein